MAVELNCRDLGAPCDHYVAGNSMDTVIAAMQQHAVDVHGYAEDHVRSAEMATAMRTAVKQSSRPSQFRTSKLDL